MSDALYHPTLGYYHRKDLTRWGREGDYRTSPERSELFAATFARYFVSLYERMGQPAEFVIVEIGAGSGHFAAGVLDVLHKRFSAIAAATRYIVVEVSEDARRRASELLERFTNVHFVDFVDLKPIHSGVVFSNELLDAFPVHRVTKVNGELKELYVTLESDSTFEWCTDELSDDALLKLCQSSLPRLAEGQIAEINPGILHWFQMLDRKLVSGYLVTVDYGAESSELYDVAQRKRGTLRAFRRHQFVDDVLEDPGECDITCSVNWSLVQAEGECYGFKVYEFAQLDRFLMQVGILQELEEQIAAASNEAERSRLTTGAREMILPGGMASSFQVLVQKR
jgi:SAM-dependent MidA family methyltransferase